MKTRDEATMIRFGFMWTCPWRVELFPPSRHEYWGRYQFGPFYALRGRAGEERS